MIDYLIEAATKEEWVERALLAEAKIATAIEALERALKYNTAMHGGAAAYNQYIIDAITDLNSDAR